MPRPPSRAIVIAVRASVTESIAALTSGVFRMTPRQSRVRTSTSRGSTSLYEGSRRTSSKVRASRSLSSSMAILSAVRVGWEVSTNRRFVDLPTFRSPNKATYTGPRHVLPRAGLGVGAFVSRGTRRRVGSSASRPHPLPGHVAWPSLKATVGLRILTVGPAAIALLFFDGSGVQSCPGTHVAGFAGSTSLQAVESGV